MLLVYLSVASIAAWLTALLSCSAIRRFALRHALVDQPNERSLHQVPVPRLGGVGVVFGTLAASLGAIGFFDAQPGPGAIPWLVCSLLVASLGLVDDLRALNASVRLAIQVSVAVAFCVAVGLQGRVEMCFGVELALPLGLVMVLAVVWTVGVLNIYNFMDGMDGLAGAQTIGAAVALGVVFAFRGHWDLSLVAFVLAASAAGFLVHNAPPARIFLGDAGSTFIGFTFAALALVGVARGESVPFLVTPLALSPFLLDGTFTIFRRLSRREAIWKAHRTHLYQRAVSSGLSHHDVLIPYAAWIAVAGGSAIIVGTVPQPWNVVWLASAMVGGLVFVWRWVVGRERAANS